MAITIKLYKTSSPPNAVNKSIFGTAGTYNNAKFLEPYDEYMPVIRIRGKISFDDCNYLLVTGNGDPKYYFIEDVIVKSPAICHIKCRLDVLMTYYDFIKGLKCYLSRSASDGNLYLPDKRPTLVYNNVEKLSFRDMDGNIEGFVIPGETKEQQKEAGMYILTIMQNGYGNKK